MIGYDGIIFALQQAGGVSELFVEILSRLPRPLYELIGYADSPPIRLNGVAYRAERPRILERYRRARLRARYEIFHSTYYRLPADSRCAIVTTIHDYVYERFAPFQRRSAHSWQKNAAVAASDALICVSESTRRDLLEFSGARFADRTIVVHNGVSDVFRVLLDARIRPDVLFIGRRAGYKNFDSVVRALETLRDLRIVCVGGGPFTELERLLLERHVPDRYEAVGYVSPEALNRLYNESLCLAYPSLYEGFGIPILEAMRAGCPVIAVNRSSVPEVAGDAALLLEVGSDEEIRAALQRLMDEETRDYFVQKGVLQAARFSWESTYRQTLRVYEQVTGRSILPSD